MKALLIGVLFAILVVIGGTVTFMIIDSRSTIEANVVTNGVSHLDDSAPVSKIQAKTNTVINTDLPKTPDGTTGTSAKDQLEALQAQEKVTTAAVSGEKTGYTLNYSMKQSGCAGLLELKQDAVDSAESDYDDAKEAYDKATAKLDNLEDADAITEAQAEVKDKKEELDSAEKALFSVREDLIKSRTTCI